MVASLVGMRSRPLRAIVALAGALATLAVGGCAAGGPTSPEGIAARDFYYRGACAWDKPATDTKLTHGNQTSTEVQIAGRSSRAQLVNTRRVLLGTPGSPEGERPFLLVRLQCSVGSDTLTAYHLLASDEEELADYGIVAAANGPIDIAEEEGQLHVRYAYRRTDDGVLHQTGLADYRVALVGETPIRLFAGEDVADVPGPVAEWKPNAWRGGIVTLAAAWAEDEPEYAIGLQVDDMHVATTHAFNRRGDGCPVMATRTHAGQVIDPIAAGTWEGQPGTGVELSMPTEADDRARIARVDLPLAGPMDGLLVTSSGMVPSLATAGTGAAPGGDGWVRVESQVETDSALATFPFGRPAGVFVTAEGEVLFSGSWVAPQAPETTDTAALMATVPDVSVPFDQPCRF